MASPRQRSSCPALRDRPAGRGTFNTQRRNIVVMMIIIIIIIIIVVIIVIIIRLTSYNNNLTHFRRY